MQRLDQRWQLPKDNWTLLSNPPSPAAQNDRNESFLERKTVIWLQIWGCCCCDGEMGGGPTIVGPRQQGFGLPGQDFLPRSHHQCLPCAFKLLLTQHQLCVWVEHGGWEGGEGETSRWWSAGNGRATEASVCGWNQVYTNQNSWCEDWGTWHQVTGSLEEDWLSKWWSLRFREIWICP